jgi:hypothetical protein
MSTRDERREFIALSEACAMRDALAAARGLAALDALHVEWAGFSRIQVAEENREVVDEDSLRDDLEDHIREVCYSTGVHCEDVFGDDA